ncbi:MAG: ABC transporter ATP-binding protein [Chloroflexota bacterium]|nr:MAG: ABC transporter ATP-binding protein [Chloroflexota bacterium]
MLHLERVSKSFRGLKAVKEVSLDVAPGEILGLIGPNGAGKTTLFNLITGVFPPSHGKIFFDSHDITATAPQQRCKMGIARTFQMVRPFLQLSVRDNVAIGRIYGREANKNRRQAESAAREMLEMVGLASRAADPACSLNLVERKRLELARALAARPKLMLLDEILAGLNPSEILSSIRLIQSVRDSGITIVIVEHLVKAIFNITDRIVVLNAGEKIAEGAPETIANDPHVIDAYLGTSLHEHHA